MTSIRRDVGRFAGGAGVVAATLAALCCAGAPIILSVLAVTGLGFLHSDGILLPVIIVALLIALWGFWERRRIHEGFGPFVLGLIGSLTLLAGVLLLHGFIAKVSIGVGAFALLTSAIWNARLPMHGGGVSIVHPAGELGRRI